MSKKKVSAPLSYDPGKGRPKEYLAYLNWQEMQALQRLNGGNMEFGPMGLPSFPPSDAIGSGQTPGTGNWSGSPGSGTASSGAGGAAGGGSDSGNFSSSNDPNSSASAATSSSSSTSTAASSNTNDISAQQATEVSNAVNAAKNNALTGDVSRAGIGSIEVGPMRTPVKIGSGAISMASASAADSINQLGQKYGLPSSSNYNMPTYSGELSSYSPSITERVANYLNSNFYGDTVEGQQRANKIVDMATNAGITLSTIAVPEVRIPAFASGVVGALSKPVINFAERIAAPVVEKIYGSGALKTIDNSEKIITDLDEFANWASSLPGRNTTKFEIDISKIPQYKTLSDYKSAQPGIVDKAIDKIEGAIDMATEAARLGTGTVPRAFGSSMLGSYNETLNNAIHGDYNDYVSDYLSDPVRYGLDYLNSGLDYVSDYFNDPRDQKGDYGGMKDGGVVSRKKITAPLSYDPGKGRPKEHLAYLNWQEMQALQRLNGGNMERGPRGLPSFPPADAIGSSQNAATGNWTGSPGGTTTSGTSSNYPGSGTSTNWGGSNNYGTDPSSWSGSGSNYGGPSSPASSAASSATSAASSAASSAAANAAASTPSSDTAAQQSAAVNDAVKAANNAALRQDIARGGIGSINVGPMQTPVRIGGGAISAAVNAAIQSSYSTGARVTPTMPGGGGMGQLNARRGSLTTAVGPLSGADAFGNIATGSMWGVSPSTAARFDSLESDLARRSLSGAFGVPESRISSPPSIPSGPFGPRLSMDKTYYPDAPDISTFGPRTYTTPSLSEFDNSPSEYDGIGGPTDRRVTEALKNTAYNAYNAISNYLSGQPSNYAADVSKLPQLTVSPPEVSNPNSMRAVGGLGIASLPGSSQSLSVRTHPSFDTIQRDYTYGGGPQMTAPGGGQTVAKTDDGLGVEGQIDLRIGPNYVPGEGYVPTVDRMGPFNTAHDLGRERIIKVENVPEIGDNLADAQIEGIEDAYRDPFAKPAVTKNYLPPSEARPKFVSPDIREIVEDQERKNRIGTKIIERAPFIGGPISLVEGVQKIFTGKDIADYGTDLKYKYLQSDEAQKAAMREKYPDMRRFAVSIGEIPPNTGGQYSSSGTPTQELGGKTYEERPSPYAYSYYRPSSSSYASKPSSNSGGESGRPYQYYLWDLGVGIPEPGDSDYNDYMKYLKSRGTSAQV